MAELHLKLGCIAGRTADSSAIRPPRNDKEGIRVGSGKLCECPSYDYSFSVLAKHFSHAVGDFAYRGVGFHGGDDVRH